MRRERFTVCGPPVIFYSCQFDVILRCVIPPSLYVIISGVLETSSEWSVRAIGYRGGACKTLRLLGPLRAIFSKCRQGSVKSQKTYFTPIVPRRVAVTFYPKSDEAGAERRVITRSGICMGSRFRTLPSSCCYCHGYGMQNTLTSLRPVVSISISFRRATLSRLRPRLNRSTAETLSILGQTPFHLV